MILLATGFSIIEEELLKRIEAQRCYNRDILIDIAREVNPETVVLSPYLPGDEDMFDIILSLRNLGKRIIYLPGDPKQKDAQDWMIKLIPFGIYDFVYDPVKVTAIIERIGTPATLGDIPQDIVKAAGEDGSGFAKEVVGSIPPPEKKHILAFITQIFRRKSLEVKVNENPFGIQENDESENQKVPEKVLLLGSAQSLATTIKNLGWEITLEEDDSYDVVLADMETYQRVHSKPTLVLGASVDFFFTLDPLQESVFPVANETAAIKYLAGKIEENPVPKTIQKQGVVAGFYSGAQGYQGKTALALNTAAILAQECEVCIVDLDTDKAGLTTLCGWNEKKSPPVDLLSVIDSSGEPVKGPGGVNIIPARLEYPGWLPSPIQMNNLISNLVTRYDYVILDFGARVASPSTITALKRCQTVFIIATPFRGALSAVARFRGKEMAEIGRGKVQAVINRVGADGAMTAKDAAAILGFNKVFTTVPEDTAFVAAETKALNGKKYTPPALGKCESKKAIEKLAEQIKKGAL